jgi:hypothetical protein
MRAVRWVAVGSGIAIAAAAFLAVALPASAADTLISRGRPATASSTENASFPASLAVDADSSTRWSSQFADPQWLQVDLGATATFTRVRLNWEAAFGRAYRIEASPDATTWTTVTSTSAGDGGVDDLTGLSGSGRYVRVYITQRGTQWGDSLFDFEVYGSFTGTPPPTTPPPATRAFPVAPYIATFIGNNVAQFAGASGQKFYTLGFVNGTGNCQPIWSTDDNQLRGYVAQLRAQGGDIIVSSGGWDADDLVSHCSTAAAIATAYQSVLTAYGTTYLDIDAEHGDVHNNLDPAVVDKRNDALKILQNNLSAAGKTLHLSFTLGVSPAGGLSGENLYVLQSAVARGLTFDVVNPMTMDYYDGVSGSQMGQASINALKKVEAQLKTLLPGRTDAQLWTMIAATPMIGQNDDPTEQFTLTDAQLLLAFAQQQHMARLSFWAINRDFGCAAGTVSGTCSGISEPNYGFSNIFRQFTG